MFLRLLSVFGINELHLKFVYKLQLYFTRNQCKNEILLKTYDFYERMRNFSEKQKFLIQIFNKNEVCFWNKWIIFKICLKLKGCSSEYVLMEPYSIVISSESVLREILRCSMKAPGMPIRYKESSRSDLIYNCLRLGWVRSIYSGRLGWVGI